ncbi:hypothetical protein M9H77_36629 [Catharanthus roseus]|uniref:Uncharacterized protein n=1 Tax=Catharanthus roseus TaxID=4058 RepID=A0ACB9ZU75_CATRO|nr:hypothetical protein M9H77_36629 [Catharanthus roseus]
MAQEFGIPIRHNRPWNSMESNYPSKEQASYMTSIIGFPTRNKVHASSSKTASSTTVRRWMKFFIKIWRLVELGCPRAIEWSIAPWGSNIETTMRTNLPLLIREISDIPSNIPHLIS